MRELVFLGSQAETECFLARWRLRVHEVLGAMGLRGELVAASDPFFGRSGRFLSEVQRARGTKLELRVGVLGAGEEDVALASLNFHHQHFGAPFAIRDSSGVASSACVAFGLDRIALALVAVNGPRIAFESSGAELDSLALGA
jgi:hypothetical protein